MVDGGWDNLGEREVGEVRLDPGVSEEEVGAGIERIIERDGLDQLVGGIECATSGREEVGSGCEI